MKAMHTKGPWRAGSGKGGKNTVVSDTLADGALNGSDAVYYYGGKMIAESVAQENIPLISAAPDLLTALQRVETVYRSGAQLDCNDAALIGAAIVRATGETK